MECRVIWKMQIAGNKLLTAWTMCASADVFSSVGNWSSHQREICSICPRFVPDPMAGGLVITHISDEQI
jgi:hypothetical protein